MKIILSLLFAFRILAAIYSNISDCDEVFNYIEPLHYLLFKIGFQTWEFSPEFAIRSWSFPLLYSFPLSISLLFTDFKPALFYLLRLLLALTSFYCDSMLFNSLLNLDSDIAYFQLIFSSVSTASFISSTALLPSSFAMYATSLAFSFANTRKFRSLIFIIGLGSLLGWPFSAILIIPLFANEICTRAIGFKSATRIIWNWLVFGLLAIFIILIPIIIADYYYYKKLAIIPLNIIIYNVISASNGKGPDIYGTEPWYFYFINLFLNFNFVWILALSTLPLLVYYCFNIDLLFYLRSSLSQKSKYKVLYSFLSIIGNVLVDLGIFSSTTQGRTIHVCDLSIDLLKCSNLFEIYQEILHFIYKML